MASNKSIQVVYTRKLTKDESVSIKVVTDNTDVIPDVFLILKEYTLYLTPAGVRETKSMRDLYRKSEFTSTSFKRSDEYFKRRDALLERLKSLIVENNGNVHVQNS
jgi:hypothetical protein